MSDTALSGRKAQAARNDARILESARAVFLADPGAPISAVAEHAGVGISALYRRYDGKEALLRKLCTDALEGYVAAGEAAVADDGDPWQAFATFMERIVDAGAGSLAQRLAGTFTPDEALLALAQRAQALNVAIVDRAVAAGVFRPGIEVGDIGLVFEQIAAVALGDDERTRQLRRRYLALALDGLHRPDGEPLPGTAPTWQEISARWSR
jgi:AcrR family transcriptional regulator